MKVQWKKQSGPLLVSSCNLVQPKRGREEPTMTRATRTAEYTGATTLCLYLAFELGSNEWKLGFTTEPGDTPRVRTMPARDLARLTREIADAKQWFGVKAATPVRSCYEAGGEPDERPAREPGPLAAAGYRRRGRGEDGAPVGRLARARGAAGPVGAGMGARAIPAHADSRVATRTPARDCPRARRGHRQSPAAAPPARGRANRRVGLCERVLRVATVPEPQGGRGGGGAHADAVPEWRREPGTRDQQGGESAHPGGRRRDGLVLVAVSAAEPPEPMVSGAVRPWRSTRSEGGDRGPRPEVVDRALALPRVRRGAGGRQPEAGVTRVPVGSGGTTE